MEFYENIHKNSQSLNLSLEYNSSVNREFLNKKKIIINNFKVYLNTLNHKCITTSCKRRHEEIYGNFMNSINDLEKFKVNVINKI